ncbi:MAG TPA: MBOAT family O-acyltransferase [Acetobacteraceae bacterium]|nr:MBOAT family O-acyltransferase [Acetobacteraceae bacterium]
MLFNSYVFVYAFLPIALAGYYSTARYGRRPAILWLIFASFVFYGWWNPAFVFLLAISIAFNYSASLLIGATESRRDLQGWLTKLAVAANLGALIYYKYAMWLAALLNDTGLVHAELHGIVLPLGISFFTFTQIGYLLDCRSGIARDRSLLDYVVFVTFFPHLIAGPILHNGEMMPQFADPKTYRFSATEFAVGLGMFVLGMLKKCLIADPVGAIVPAAYAHPEILSAFGAWQAVLSYSLQLYFDFSGYSDMAIGLALMFNLRFPLNFNSPYKSQSVVEYWQRWHMTLTRYFTQYIYNPLAVAAMRRRMARKQPINRQAQMTLNGFVSMAAWPIFVTILLAGIWHGAGATFLVFGLLHAIYLTINRACRIWRPNPPEPTRFGVVWRVALTYGAVLVASVFFRAPSVPAALSMLGGMIGLHSLGGAATLSHVAAPAVAAQAALAGISWPGSWHSAERIVCIAMLYVVVWAMPNTQQIFAEYRPALDEVIRSPVAWLRWRPSPRWALVMGCATTLAALAMGGTGEFLYFQF